MTPQPQRAEVSPPNRRLVGSRRTTPSLSQPLSEALFRDALTRERRRADRFETPVGLVLVFRGSAEAHLGDVRPALAIVAESVRDTDIVGWFEQEAVLGIVRWSTDASDSASNLQADIERSLERRLGVRAAGEYRVRAHVYVPSHESESPFFESRDACRRAGRLHQSAKRAIDVVGSAALLVASSPALLVIAALVKASSKGPVLFNQQRVGQAGRPFNMLKFRTMRADAGHELHQQFVSQFIQGQVRGEDGTAPVFKIVADPRVTSVGHFLRRSSLDELPQFWNVLKGEMSLVGPRPPLPYEVRAYKTWHWRRVLEAKPGITGLWQVTGRSRTTFDEMVRLDIRYARNQSVWADLKILLSTPRAVLSGSGAH